jgi:aerobic-type carbon monoxide dehydrogenase small subunit (CoxS/CutS family)
MAGEIKIRVNEQMHSVAADPDTPLLYVLMNDLQLQGPRFGCGLAQCGSCSVLLDGEEIRSCVTPVSAVVGKSVTTLEGLPAWYAKQKKLAKAPELHPVQQALIDEQAVQCGYCFNGMIIQAADLLSKTPHPTEAQIRTAMNGHLCRCGTYPRVIKAIQRASHTMSASAGNAPGGEAVAQEISAAEVIR